jgi:hypothetical protein
VATQQTVVIPVALAAGSNPIGHVLTVTASDACQSPATGDARYNATVDLVPPTVAITAPAGGALLAVNDRNPATEGLLDCCTGPSGPYDITAQVQGGATSATLKVNGTVKAQAAVGTDGVARFANVALEQGTLALVSEAMDAAGNVGASAPVTILVDSIPPKVSITDPTSGQSLATNAVNVTVRYKDVEAGRTIRVREGATVLGTGVTLNGDPSAQRTTTVQVPLQQGQHVLLADVTDVNGNVGLSPEVPITVTTTNPVVVFEVPGTNPAFFNRQSGTIDASNRLHASLVVASTAPAGATAFLYRSGSLAGTAQLASVGGVNKATFADQIFAAAETGTLQVRVRLDPGGTDTACPGDSNNFCSTTVPYTVDLEPPTIAWQTPPCKAFLTTNDTQPVGSGSFVFTFTTNAENGQTVAVTSSATQASATGTVLSGIATTTGLALPQGPQKITARVSDKAGNEGKVECDTQVDLLPPSVSALSVTRSPARRSRVTLSWVMPGDDGTSGSVSSYEIRERSCALAEVCGITSDQEFDAATLVPNLPPIVAGGTPMTLVVDDIALERRYTFAIRATDRAGNVAAITSTSVSTAFGTETVAGPSGNESFYGYSIAAGKLARDSQGNDVYGVVIGRLDAGSGGGIRVIYSDGRAPTDFTESEPFANAGLAVANAGDVDEDGFDDILVGAPGTLDGGKAYLFFGGPNGLQVADSLAARLLLTPPAEGSGYYGQSLAGLGNVSGVSGARPHFAVGAADLVSQAPTAPGRVFVYNVTGQRPNLTLNLVATLVGGSPADFFGTSVCGVGDVNGDQIPDLVVGAPRFSSAGTGPYPNGAAYVFLGGVSLAGTVQVPSPDLPTDGVVPLQDMSGLTPDWFGYSCARTGDLDGDGLNDFAVSAPGVGAARIYLFRGRTDLDAQPPIQADASLVPPNAVIPAGLFAGEDIDGDGLPDLVVGDAEAVHLFLGDRTALAHSAPAVTFPVPAHPFVIPHAVTFVRNWKNLLPGETGLPDIVIANPPGKEVIIRY